MGKAEGQNENWHGHVTALTVSPDYRRLGLAATLMKFLEEVSEKLASFAIKLSNKLIQYFLIICRKKIYSTNDFFVSVNCFRKQAYFVDLFVRVSNKVAIKMYQQLGYIVYRTVLEYYSGDPDEDAYGKSNTSYSCIPIRDGVKSI